MAKAKKSRASRFGAWFTLQYGPRKYSGEFSNLNDAELQDLIDQGHRADREMARRHKWDERKQHALYAWCARDSESPSVRQGES